MTPSPGDTEISDSLIHAGAARSQPGDEIDCELSHQAASVRFFAIFEQLHVSGSASTYIEASTTAHALPSKWSALPPLDSVARDTNIHDSIINNEMIARHG